MCLQSAGYEGLLALGAFLEETAQHVCAYTVPTNERAQLLGFLPRRLRALEPERAQPTTRRGRRR